MNTVVALTVGTILTKISNGKEYVVTREAYPMVDGSLTGPTIRIYKDGKATMQIRELTSLDGYTVKV